jgi:hypothetical protein
MKENDIDYIIYLLKSNTFSDSEESKKEMGEQDAATGAGGGGGKTAYPAVTKWSSGRKFGPTYNPEQKKWTSNITRGKANTLL